MIKKVFIFVALFTMTAPLFGESLKLDTNGKPVSGGISTDPTPVILQLRVDPVTKRLLVDAAGASLTISGTTTSNQGTPNTNANAWPVRVTNTVTVDTELPAAVPLADGASASPTTSTIGSIALLMNSTTVDRQRAVFAGFDSDGEGVAASGIVGQLDDTAPSTVTENAWGPVRITGNRGLHINLRNAAGSEIGTASLAVRVDPIGTTTQPISAISLPLPTGAASEVTLANLNSTDFAVESGGNLDKIAGGKITVTAFLASGSTVAVTASTALPVNITGTPKVQGTAANGTPFSGNPVMTGGFDGTDAIIFRTNSSGSLHVIGEGTAGLPSGEVLTVQGETGMTPITISIPTSTAGLGTLMNPLVVSSQARTRTAKTARLLQASSGAAVDTVVLTPTSGKKAIITSCEISTDKTSRIQVHFGTTVSNTNTISGGFYAADGGSFGAFDGNPIPGATNQTVTVDYTQTSGNLLINLTYYEE